MGDPTDEVELDLYRDLPLLDSPLGGVDGGTNATANCSESGIPSWTWNFSLIFSLTSPNSIE